MGLVAKHLFYMLKASGSILGIENRARKYSFLIIWASFFSSLTQYKTVSRCYGVQGLEMLIPPAMEEGGLDRRAIINLRRVNSL